MFVLFYFIIFFYYDFRNQSTHVPVIWIYQLLQATLYMHDFYFDCSY